MSYIPNMLPSSTHLNPVHQTHSSPPSEQSPRVQPPIPITNTSEGFSQKFKKKFHALSSHLTKKPQTPQPLADLPENANQDQIRRYLNQWVQANPSEKNRKAVKKKILGYLSSPMNYLFSTPTGILTFLPREPLPPIFHLLPIKNTLRALEIRGGLMTELPESIGQLTNLDFLRLKHCLQLQSISKKIKHLKLLSSLIVMDCPELKTLPTSIGKLTMLSSLELYECPQLQALPDTIGDLRNLEQLILNNCTHLEHLPAFDDLTRLSHIDIEACPKITELPASLYTLALSRRPDFLPEPWEETLNQMRGSTYRLAPSGRPEIQIHIKRNTTVLFAQEHLKLLTDALHQAAPNQSVVLYKGEQGSDAGGISRDFWSHLIHNIAEQTENDRHPLLTDSGEGHYLLKKNGPLTPQHLALCRNIGKLLSALLGGLAQNGYKLGQVFPEHFYVGLFSLLHSYSTQPLPISFESMKEEDQKALCFCLARSVKGGMFYKLPFNLKQQLTQSDPIEPQVLFNLWQILNMNRDEEDLERAFPTMKPFIGSFTPPENLPAFAKEFRQSFNPDNASLAEQVVLQSAYESYAQEAAPLVAVAQGFNSRIGAAKEIQDRTLSRFPRSQLQAARQLSELVEGIFTVDAFLHYMDDSIDHFIQTHPRASSGFIHSLRWLKEWCHDAGTTPGKMQAFLRFVHAAPTIPLTRIQFTSIREIPNDFRSQQIRVHTCFVGLDLPESLGKIGEATEGVSEEQRLQKGKETFFAALEAVMSSSSHDPFNMA